MAAKYTLELFPTTEESAAMYTKLFLGASEFTPNDGNAGVDLLCVNDQIVNQGANATLLGLGVKARMVRHWQEYVFGAAMKKKGYCHYWLAPRSSIWKSGVRQANSIGVIDKSYRGELMGAVLSNVDGPVSITANTRLFQVLAPDMGSITQVILKPLSELDSTERGEGGFGSTGT
jgi:dUTPase